MSRTWIRGRTLLASTTLACAIFTNAYAVDFAALRTLADGAPAAVLANAIAAELRTAAEDTRAAIEQELVAVVLDPAASAVGRREACRLLPLCATPRSAAALAPLLADPAMSEQVRLALEGAPGTVVDLAFMAALGQTEGEVRRGIISSLASRRTGAAFAPLTELATRSDELTAIAALRALAEVARDGRDASLIAALTFEGEPLLVAQQHAFFTALARLADRDVALDEVVIPFPKMQARTAEVADLAVVVMLRVNPAAAVPQIIALLQSGDADNARRASSAIVRLTGEERRAALVARAAEVPAAAWPLMIRALSERGGAEIRPLVQAALEVTDEGTRLAALAALERVGMAEDVPQLLQFAASGGASGSAALEVLRRMTDRSADPLLVAEFRRAESPLRLQLPDIFAARVMRDTVPLLLDVAASAERRLAGECYAAAGQLGDRSMIPRLWERWQHAEGSNRLPVERALVAIARIDETGEATNAITARWEHGDREIRTAVIRMAAGAGTPAALAFLEMLASSSPPDETALRAITTWRSLRALPVLSRLVTSGKLSEPLRAIAWNGMLDLSRNRLRTDRWDAFEGLRQTMAATDRLEEQRRVVAVVAAGNTLPWAELLDEWVDLPGIGPEASAAATALRQRIGEI